MTIGNKLFGDIPKLYNVNLAQYFFIYAAYPLVGEHAPYAHYQLSRTYFIQGRQENALREAEKELDAFPEHKRTYYILGLTLGYMDRVDEAIEAFGKFIEWKPETWAARNDRAWLQFRKGDIDGALETLKPVINQTKNPWVQNTYGTLLLNNGRYDEARVAFEYAHGITESMTEETWGMAYPGNDPRVYEIGLKAMRMSIRDNLELLEKTLTDS